MAVCTSVAAASRPLFRLNCSVRVANPCVLLLVTSSSPLICKNCRSSGVATLAAIVSGLAPGYSTLTWMTGERSGVPGDAVEDRQRRGKDEGGHGEQRAGDPPACEQEAVDQQDGSIATDPAALFSTHAGGERRAPKLGSERSRQDFRRVAHAIASR